MKRLTNSQCRPSIKWYVTVCCSQFYGLCETWWMLSWLCFSSTFIIMKSYLIFHPDMAWQEPSLEPKRLWWDYEDKFASWSHLGTWNAHWRVRMNCKHLYDVPFLELLIQSVDRSQGERCKRHLCQNGRVFCQLSLLRESCWIIETLVIFHLSSFFIMNNLQWSIPGSKSSSGHQKWWNGEVHSRCSYHQILLHWYLQFPFWHPKLRPMVHLF